MLFLFPYHPDNINKKFPNIMLVIHNRMNPFEFEKGEQREYCNKNCCRKRLVST